MARLAFTLKFYEISVSSFSKVGLLNADTFTFRKEAKVIVILT